MKIRFKNKRKTMWNGGNEPSGIIQPQRVRKEFRSTTCRKSNRRMSKNLIEEQLNFLFINFF